MNAQMDRKEVASQALTKALTFQSPVARNNLERLRRVHPDETPTELAKRVTRYYLSLVTTSGGAMGAARLLAVLGVQKPAQVFVRVRATGSKALLLRTAAATYSFARPRRPGGRRSTRLAYLDLSPNRS
jgi:hypothetical protein